MSERYSWREAVVQVLRDRKEAMHYTEIADEIVSRQLTRNIGATPANSVATFISVSLKEDGGKSPFDRTARGFYRLREPELGANPTVADHQVSEQPLAAPADEAKEQLV